MPQLLYRTIFFNDTATTAIYTLSLHDALPISRIVPPEGGATEFASGRAAYPSLPEDVKRRVETAVRWRSEEHTSELQSRGHLVCRLLLEKKKTIDICCLCLNLAICSK